jgi:uncharacterized protein YggE
MRVFRFIVLAAILLGTASLSIAQQIQVDRQNRTIYLSATETVRVDAETAIVRVGYFNYGSTHDQTYKESADTANRITQALLSAGIQKEAIETEESSFAAVESPNREWTPTQKADRQFQAHQSWKVRVAAADAQNVVNIAEAAGANEVREVEWGVVDTKALEAKAEVAALSRAKLLAQQLAQQGGAKLGPLLYAGNQEPPIRSGSAVYKGWGAGGGVGGGIAQGAPPPPTLKIFPEKVEESATVYAIFSLE